MQAIPVEGTWPRSLNMSPDGKFLVNCCLAGQIIVYRVGEDGKLTDTGHHGFTKDVNQYLKLPKIAVIASQCAHWLAMTAKNEQFA